MIEQRPGDTGDFSPETLAAYVDGELDLQARQQVEAWLVSHPEAVADVEGQRRLMNYWQSAAPTDPAAARWQLVLTCIEAALPALSSWRRGRLRFGRAGLLIAGVAAAALFALSIPRSPQLTVVPKNTDSAESFPVVGPDDVEIVRIHAADRMSLVVGTPPLEGALEWAAPGDVTIENVSPDTDGMRPTLATDEPNVPMIMAPLTPAAEPAR